MSSGDTALIEKASFPNIFIPDHYWQGVQDDIKIEEQAQLETIEVDVSIEHPYINDLVVSLSAPSGKTVYLHNRTGGSQDNLIQTYNSESATVLQKFSGENTHGTWTISITDKAYRDTGTLKSWSVKIKVRKLQDVSNWTVLAYIIGDDKPNSSGFSLDSYGLQDIKEMKKIGSTDNIKILAHRDCWQQTGTWRFDIGVPDGDVMDDIVEFLPEKNAGDPDTLLEFVEWGVQRAPAEHYLLILWNHGSGWYVPETMRSTSMTRNSTISNRAERRHITRARIRRAIFSTTVDKIFSTTDPQVRGICYDDTSADCLDNKELAKVLQQCAAVMKKEKIDLIGMDACLMNMVEVAYQMRNHTSILVGSEESEPANGWPYDLVLTKLRDEPETTPEILSLHILESYALSYSDEDITQSSIDLSKLDDLTTAIDDLAGSLIVGLNADVHTKLKIGEVRQAVTEFYGQSMPGTGMYVDLYDLVDLLAGQNLSTEITEDALKVKGILDNPNKTPVIGAIHEGYNMRNTHGLSIHFPFSGDDSMYYRDLDFCKATKWPDFLLKYKQARTIRR
ncbi:MAG: proprotein convertase P-domain-containing protein [Proteobacteria bacterium]|nr:proprotein convertase P-domain-containing protein [Pseudomonadota bacterium]MBU1057709.1 proprotein convertase P-domain-containing protein [Pseudomonadota bacterium]